MMKTASIGLFLKFPIKNQYIKLEIMKNNNIYMELTKLHLKKWPRRLYKGHYFTFSGEKQRRSTHSTNEYYEWTGKH